MTLNERGFTLIEIVVTLVIVGISAALAGMWIVNLANGYIFTIQNANTVQKGQLAITRIAKELNALQSVTSSSATGITFNRIDAVNTSGIPIILSQNGNTLQLNGHILTDNVSTFNLQYYNDDPTSTTYSSSWSTTPTDPTRIIKVTLTLSGANNTPSTFIIRAMPRNI
jgi:prepilin-type N-terminal cleavage/methylation domain-containing protein